MDNSAIDLGAVGKKIRETRKQLGLTQPELAKKVGLSPASVSKYESGGVQTAPLSKLADFAQALGVSADWLIGMDADRAETAAFEAGLKRGPKGARIVPVVGETAAGAPMFTYGDADDYMYADEGDGTDFALKVRGDSMINARICDGDIVFVRKQDMVDNGDIAVIAVDDGFGDSYVTTKRFFKYGSTIVLRPENPAFQDIEIPAESGVLVRVVGKVVFVKSYL